MTDQVGADQQVDKLPKAQRTRGRLARLPLIYSREIVFATITGVVITIISNFILEAYYRSDAPPAYAAVPAEALPNFRSHYLRAKLGQALVAMTSVKMYYAEYYTVRGRFPASEKDVDLARFDLTENPEITGEAEMAIPDAWSRAMWRNPYIGELFGWEHESRTIEFPQTGDGQHGA